MPRPTWLLTGCVLASFLLGACGGAATPTAAPTAVPTVAPTVAPPTATTVPTVAPTATLVPTAVPTAVPAAPAKPAVLATRAATDVKPEPATRPRDPGAPSGPAGLLASLKLSPPEMAGRPGAAPIEPKTTLAKETKAALTKITSFRVEGVITSKTEGKIDVLLEYVAPESLRLSAKLDVSAAKKPEAGMPDRFDLILIGKTLYLKGGDEWVKIEGDSTTSSANSEDFGQALVQALNDEGFAKLGSETINGEPCDIYAKTEDGATAKLWVSTRDSFLRKLEAGDADTQIVLVVSDVNKPIVIKAPI